MLSPAPRLPTDQGALGLPVQTEKPQEEKGFRRRAPCAPALPVSGPENHVPPSSGHDLI